MIVSIKYPFKRIIMYKTRISKSYKSNQTFDKIISIVRNELNVKVGNTNISPKGRISVNDFDIKQKTQNAYVSSVVIEGFIKQNGNDVDIEISVKTKGGRAILIGLVILSIMLLIVIIGPALIPAYFVIVYLYHRRTCNLVRRSLDNIEYDL